MAFRRSLADYKRTEHASDVFPGERRTLSGRFAGSGRRLVHVDPAGSIRDYSYPLCGLHGITASRFGVRAGESSRWFDGVDAASQRYHEDTALVETVHEFDEFDVVQRDLSVGLAHSTAFELRGDWPDDAAIAGFVEFFPDGREGRVGQLIRDGVVEAYHDREHDFLGASTELRSITPEAPSPFEDVLSDEPPRSPGSSRSDDYEGSRLTGGVSFRAAVEDGSATVTTLLADVEDQSRSESVSELGTMTERHGSPSDVRRAATHSSPRRDTSESELVTTDRRVLRLLSAPTGARIAGPDFDPYYQYSGGYGYTLFRDDAEIAGFLLEADRELSLGLADAHRKSVRFYLDAQLDDGRWPHRVWPRNGRLAPGWANGHLEGKERHYQADQTASALTFLAEYLTQCRESTPEATLTDVRGALARGVGGLDRTLERDGLPATCENAWENMDGRFTHTAAGFLQAYSAIATAPCRPTVCDHAADQARRLYDALDELWIPDDGIYALRSIDGELDDRADCTTFSLVDAHLAFAELAGIDDERRHRLDRHLTATFERLWKETDAVRGLKRFEGDTWRRLDQGGEKIWTVSTGWGAYTAEAAMRLFADGDRTFDAAAWSDRLFAQIDLGGSLCLPSGYLPEQFFDSGSPDSATPLGWSHGIRLATFAARRARTA